jgi:hypothetical protein
MAEGWSGETRKWFVEQEEEDIANKKRGGRRVRMGWVIQAPVDDFEGF